MLSVNRENIRSLQRSLSLFSLDASVSPHQLSRLIVLPLIFPFTAAVALIGAAITRSHTDFAWKTALAFSPALLAFGPLLAMHAIRWLARRPATLMDAIVAAVLSLCAIPLFMWTFRYFGHVIAGATFPQRFIDLLRFFAFVFVVLSGFSAMRLTKRWS